MLPLFIVFSLFLLWRGHNEPGGGFVGGLVAAAGFVLYGLAYGPTAVRRAIKVNLKSLIGVGLGAALLSGMISVFLGQRFFTGLWAELPLPGGSITLGTPVLFDVGVYLVVVGVVLTIVMARMEDE